MLAVSHYLPFKSDPWLKLNTFNLLHPKIPPQKYFNNSQENLRWYTHKERICNLPMNYGHILLRALQNRRNRGMRIKKNRIRFAFSSLILLLLNENWKNRASSRSTINTFFPPERASESFLMTGFCFLKFPSLYKQST